MLLRKDLADPLDCSPIDQYWYLSKRYVLKRNQSRQEKKANGDAEKHHTRETRSFLINSLFGIIKSINSFIHFLNSDKYSAPWNYLNH